ncbi:MAG: Rossmann-like and DUF2520 domain-containing protein [Balneolaceae bacterium]
MNQDKTDRTGGKQDVSVIGPGAVGSSLAEALSEAGYKIKSVFTRNPNKSRGYSHRADVTYLLSDMEWTNLGDLIFITTPDDFISDVAETLSGIPGNWKDRMVVHCSGLLTSDELADVSKKGALTASFHPLQTFTGQSGENAFQDISISVEGDEKAVSALQDIVSDLQSRPVLLNKEQKSMLHVSAVFLSNYMVALGSISDKLIRTAIPDADLTLLKPLLLQTASNLSGNPPAEALTGPLARGDSRTVRKHLRLLSDYPEFLKVYKILGQVSLHLAEKSESLTDLKMQELKSLLEER